ncbi:MAG: YraN family protein [Caldilineales bacterium]
MPTSRRRLGDWGEQLAVDLLLGKGYRLLARNWRAGRSGELDLVMQQGDCLVAVEVRTRRGDAYGRADESLTAAKQARLAQLIEIYCAQQAWHGPRRVDVVAISLDVIGHLQELRHIEDAVSGE